MIICVYGSSSENIDKKYYDISYKLCKELAKRGHNLVFGAGGTGLMGAAANGFYDGGAKVHGVIPTFFEDNGFEGMFYKANKITRTKTMAERKDVMETEGEAFIILPGGIGTLEEFFEILSLKQLGRTKKAIVVYNINGFYDKLEQFIDYCIKNNTIREGCKNLYKVCNDENEIISYIENYNTDNLTGQKFKS